MLQVFESPLLGPQKFVRRIARSLTPSSPMSAILTRRRIGFAIGCQTRFALRRRHYALQIAVAL